MKPAPFEYHAPSTVDEVVSLMTESEDAELMAGNQSLALDMSSRQTTPEHLIDLNKVEDLQYIEEGDGEIEIGAMTSHTTIVESDLLDQKLPLLSNAAKTIAGPSVRNRGTLGGSLGKAHPAGTYPAVMTAFDAILTLTSSDGDREVGIQDFFVAHRQTDVRECELIKSVTIQTDPFPIGRTGMSFHDIKETTHQWPKLSAEGIVRVDDPTTDDPIVEEARLAFANAADVPLRVEAAEDAVEGTPLSDDTLEEAAEEAMNAAKPADQMQADAEYKEDQVSIFARRALQTAHNRVMKQ